MNLKKKLGAFFTLTRKSSGGFTLVELIVVIAVLAILGGVAVPAYGAYVTKANKQADISLAGEVAKALTLYYYANPDEVTTASVVLTADGAEVAQGDAVAAAAMEAVFGANWAEAAKLKYDKWGNGALVAQEVVGFFTDNTKWDPALEGIFNGTADISFKDNIPELFDLMETTAIGIAGLRSDLGSGANMVTGAAGLTTSNKNPAEFAELWASSAWNNNYLMNGGDYNANAGQQTGDTLKGAIANAAVLKARNVALATYLRDLDPQFEEAADIIENYTLKDGNGNATKVPGDVAGELFGANAQNIGLGVLSNEIQEAVGAAVIEYYNLDGSDPTASQAYTDGLAYFAMMDTVDELKNSGNLDQSNDETWWNDLYSGIEMYGAVANGSISMSELNDLYSGTAVVDNSVVALLVVEEGVPTVIISPATANP